MCADFGGRERPFYAGSAGTKTKQTSIPAGDPGMKVYLSEASVTSLNRDRPLHDRESGELRSGKVSGGPKP
ncbi:hypothetical protein [Paenibacillus sp. GCM10012303]|uniref:hypothetical protein n=1 Tax=Paenibacillus sp. GCM10012303 TaxID=3317340 RepID=UPI00360F0B73